MSQYGIVGNYISKCHWFGHGYFLSQSKNTITRQCCGPNRPFNFHVTDPAGLEVLHFKRFFQTTYPLSLLVAISMTFILMMIDKGKWKFDLLPITTFLFCFESEIEFFFFRDCVCAPCGWPNCFCCLCPCGSTVNIVFSISLSFLDM